MRKIMTPSIYEQIMIMQQNLFTKSFKYTSIRFKLLSHIIVFSLFEEQIDKKVLRDHNELKKRTNVGKYKIPIDCDIH